MPQEIGYPYSYFDSPHGMSSMPKSDRSPSKSGRARHKRIAAFVIGAALLLAAVYQTWPAATRIVAYENLVHMESVREAFQTPFEAWCRRRTDAGHRTAMDGLEFALPLEPEVIVSHKNRTLGVNFAEGWMVMRLVRDGSFDLSLPEPPSDRLVSHVNLPNSVVDHFELMVAAVQTKPKGWLQVASMTPEGFEQYLTFAIVKSLMANKSDGILYMQSPSAESLAVGRYVGERYEMAMWIRISQADGHKYAGCQIGAANKDLAHRFAQSIAFSVH